MQPAAFLAILATTLVLLLCFPALIAMGDGHTSDLAKGIGGVLYDFESTGSAPATTTSGGSAPESGEDAGAGEDAAEGGEAEAGDAEESTGDDASEE
jgi:hypothetical protein